MSTLLVEAHVKSGLAIGGVAGTGGDLYSSSRGPGYAGIAATAAPERPGGRIKPDLATPATGLSARSNAACDCRPWVVAGTSSAAPLASSLAALTRQYFVDGYYPGGSPGSSPGFSPTNALLKAILINATRSMGGSHAGDEHGTLGSRPTHGQGWGRPVLDDTLFFAGDPLRPAPLAGEPGERSFLLVLDDAPNGLPAGIPVADGREDILEAYSGALEWAVEEGDPEDREHVYTLAIDRREDVHVTLVWSDPPPDTADLGRGQMGANPLRNDLDLELIAPDGTVYRPQPGLNTADLARLWVDGYSDEGDAECPSACTALCEGSSERLHPQDLAQPCDFAGRDRVNTVENVFLKADPAGAVGLWRARVLFYDHVGANLTEEPAWPNLNDTDMNMDHDFISDNVQGYALVASGNVATPSGVPYFGASHYDCGDTVEVFVRDADLSGSPVVRIETDLGDCDEISLVQSVPPAPAFLWHAAVTLTVRDDAEAGVDPQSCLSTDNIIVAADDSYIRVTYGDTSPTPRERQATTHVSCRNLDFVSAEAYEVGSSPCDPDLAGGPIQLVGGGAAYLVVTFDNPTGPDATGLTATLVPDLHSIEVGPGSVTMPNAPTGGTTTATFPILVRESTCPQGPHCDGTPIPLRFRVEVRGDLGFKDRSYFDVPLDCLGSGMDDFAAARPPEVFDTQGLGVPSLMVAKNPSSPEDLDVSWEELPGVVAYDIWRGHVHALLEGGYDHAIAADDQADDMCGVSPAGPGLLTQRVGEELSDHPGSLYYLVTARNPCPAGHALAGSAGFARGPDGTGGLMLFDERPAGLSQGCAP